MWKTRFCLRNQSRKCPNLSQFRQFRQYLTQMQLNSMLMTMCYHGSNSSIGISSASFPTIAFATFHTWMRLSSAALHSTQGSFKFQLKSDMRLVWPPCMNNLVPAISLQMRTPLQCITYSSGGPSSASSGVCSSPTRLRSQKHIRLS